MSMRPKYPLIMAIIGMGTMASLSQEGNRRMETAPQATGFPRFAALSVQENRQSGRNQFVRAYRDAHGGLHTQLFFERPHHGGEMSIYTPVDWKERVPDGAELRGANAGCVNDYFHNFWVTWTEPGKLKALSIVQEDPLTAPLEANDALIEGPVMGAQGRLHVFLWRKESGGYGLFEHAFTGAAKLKGELSTRRLLTVREQPLVARTEPIALRWVPEKGPVDAGLAVIGWLSRDGDGLRAHAAWHDGKEAKEFRSDPVSGYSPFSRQRIGLWADPDSGILRMAWVMKRNDADSVRMAEWMVRTETGIRSLRIGERGQPASKLHATACVILRNGEEPDATCYFLAASGNLFGQSQDRLRKIRDKTPLDYDFPIYASAFGIWEARPDAEGKIGLAAMGL